MSLFEQCGDKLRARLPDREAALLRSCDIQSETGPCSLPSDDHDFDARGNFDCPNPRPGERTSGPFRGLRGLCAGMAPRERVIVLLRLLGGQQRISVPEGDVEPISRG